MTSLLLPGISGVGEPGPAARPHGPAPSDPPIALTRPRPGFEGFSRVDLCSGKRPVYTRGAPVAEAARAARDRLQARAGLRQALRANPERLPTLYRAAVLLRDHGDDARVWLHHARAEGTTRSWGVDLDHVDGLLAQAGVPAAGEQSEMFGREMRP